MAHPKALLVLLVLSGTIMLIAAINQIQEDVAVFLDVDGVT